LLAIGIGAWLGLALLGLVHLGVSVSHLRRLKRACRAFPHARERRLPRWLAARGDGRRVRLCLSDDVRSASAFGLELGSDAAIVAINPSLLADVDDDELDHLILHAYAHIQRWDDWMHVLQLALQAVLVVHPAVLWIGRALRLEREAACDDWVIERTQMATTYARCLTKVAAFELATPNDLIAAMGVVGRRGNLTHRIERLLAPPRIARTRLAALPVASVAVLLIAATVGLWQLPLLVGTKTASVEPAPADIVDIAARSAAVATTVESLVDPLAIAAAIVVKPERFQARGRSDSPEGLDSNARRVASMRRSVIALTSPDASREAARDGAIPHARLAVEEASAPSTAAASPSPIAARVLDMTSLPIATPSPPGPLEPGFGFGIASNAGVGADADANPGASAENGLTDAVGAKNRRAWQRAAGVGVTVSQGAANVGITVGQGAKRVGTATGGFLTHVATSIGKALP
jgi:beta-lactamase regulating signal transducer with metallopeptidase domain